MMSRGNEHSIGFLQKGARVGFPCRCRVMVDVWSLEVLLVVRRRRRGFPSRMSEGILFLAMLVCRTRMPLSATETQLLVPVTHLHNMVSRHMPTDINSHRATLLPLCSHGKQADQTPQQTPVWRHGDRCVQVDLPVDQGADQLRDTPLALLLRLLLQWTIGPARRRRRL